MLLFDLDPAVGLARARGRADADEPAFEEATLLEAAAGVYRSIDRAYIARIDAAAAPDEVAEELAAVVTERLGFP